ncbi:hypothetical protein NMY22_g2022 [Coprinellus aureogranulatus]|nr:hypothetical protein NMY22_g2022 [Coprinellus aureogranulatus]
MDNASRLSHHLTTATNIYAQEQLPCPSFFKKIGFNSTLCEGISDVRQYAESLREQLLRSESRIQQLIEEKGILNKRVKLLEKEAKSCVCGERANIPSPNPNEAGKANTTRSPNLGIVIQTSRSVSVSGAEDTQPLLSSRKQQDDTNRLRAHSIYPETPVKPSPSSALNQRLGGVCCPARDSDITKKWDCQGHTRSSLTRDEVTKYVPGQYTLPLDSKHIFSGSFDTPSIWAGEGVASEAHLCFNEARHIGSATATFVRGRPSDDVIGSYRPTPAGTDRHRLPPLSRLPPPPHRLYVRKPTIPRPHVGTIEGCRNGMGAGCASLAGSRIRSGLQSLGNSVRSKAAIEAFERGAEDVRGLVTNFLSLGEPGARERVGGLRFSDIPLVSDPHPSCTPLTYLSIESLRVQVPPARARARAEPNRAREHALDETLREFVVVSTTFEPLRFRGQQVVSSTAVLPRDPRRYINGNGHIEEKVASPNPSSHVRHDPPVDRHSTGAQGADETACFTPRPYPDKSTLAAQYCSDKAEGQSADFCLTGMPGRGQRASTASDEEGTETVVLNEGTTTTRGLWEIVRKKAVLVIAGEPRWNNLGIRFRLGSRWITLRRLPGPDVVRAILVFFINFVICSHVVFSMPPKFKSCSRVSWTPHHITTGEDECDAHVVVYNADHALKARWKDGITEAPFALVDLRSPDGWDPEAERDRYSSTSNTDGLFIPERFRRAFTVEWTDDGFDPSPAHERGTISRVYSGQSQCKRHLNVPKRSRPSTTRADDARMRVIQILDRL